MEDVGALEQGLTSKIIFLVCCRYGYYVKRRDGYHVACQTFHQIPIIFHTMKLEKHNSLLQLNILFFCIIFVKKKKKTGTLNVYIYFKMSRKEQYTKPFMKSL